VFDIPKEPGLVKALSNGTAARDSIRPTAVNPLVHLLPAGRLHKSPHSLFGRGHLKSLVDELRNEYRYIVIDTPPVLSASESLVVAKAADGALICTLRESSRAGQVRLTYQRLQAAGARVIGVVLSGVPTKTYAYRYGSYGYNKPLA
jgi:Mrp family chromosome partitioning ATPase